ncbi:hypothetical protein JQX13_51620 [Archangium violaceum]|uniref:hypothetical protein n=1 Tax=Archangium violaceum TaxID=83451 RepID=UPI00193B312C|nr:hypothetical protein [Archangium violaceum]QRK08288.1 hypothetical protein JQX13_51620 [Archangium violaceum]
MSEKDVLKVPLAPTPPEREREAGSEEDEQPTRSVPVMNPDAGPAGTPSLGDKRRIIEPANPPGRYPGVSVT